MMNEPHNNSTVDAMLSEPGKGVDRIPRTPGGTLARLFRKFLVISNVSGMMWNRLMDDYVNMVKETRTDGKPGLISVKGNTTKVLSKKEMTIKNFIDGLRFLQSESVRIIVIRKDFRGREYTAEETIYLDNPEAIQRDYINETESEE